MYYVCNVPIAKDSWPPGRSFLFLALVIDVSGFLVTEESAFVDNVTDRDQPRAHHTTHITQCQATAWESIHFLAVNLAVVLSNIAVLRAECLGPLLIFDGSWHSFYSFPCSSSSKNPPRFPLHEKALTPFCWPWSKTDTPGPGLGVAMGAELNLGGLRSIISHQASKTVMVPECHAFHNKKLKD